MTDPVRWFLVKSGWAVLVYFLVLNTIYLVLVLIAAREAVRHFRRAPYVSLDEVFSSPLTPAVSIVVPAYNEETTIVENVRAMLALQYPTFEVVVVEDGSTDDTFAVLRDTFDLVEVPRAIPEDVPSGGKPQSVHVPRGGEPLVVVRKDAGLRKKTDANNVGINAARYPLVCMVDADSLLDEDALLHVVKPFLEDPDRVVASGGSIRVANDSKVLHGRVVAPVVPHGWLPRIQVIEYLRAFLMGRTGWARLQSLLVLSGAFGVFRRDLVVEVGGYDLTSVGEDAELVGRIHRHLRDREQDYRVVFVPEPVCWTEVPSSYHGLASQRRRWSRGMAETMWTHRRMLANPRYGRIGLVVMPYFFVFETLGAIVELTGFVCTAIGLAIGAVNVQFAILFATVAIGYSILLSVASLAVEEFSFRRYVRTRDLAAMVMASVVENIGFRQIHAWWRTRGIVDALRRRDSSWVAIQRSGFVRADPTG